MSPSPTKWWELWPGRLQFELAELSRAGIEHHLDQTAFQNGLVQLDLAYLYNGERFELRALFPELFPYFRPEVVGKAIFFSKHQNPFGGNLCLLGRRTHNWNTNWTLARILKEQFPQLVEAARTPAPAEANEERQGEPVTAFFAYEDDAMVLVDIPPLPSQAQKGTMDLRFADGNRLFACVTAIQMAGHAPINVPPPSPQFSGKVSGQWFRLAAPPPVDTAANIENYLVAEKLLSGGYQWQKLGNLKLDVVGLTFPEEIQYHVFGEAWLFLVRVRHETGKIQKFLARAGRTGRAEAQCRIPNLQFLTSKTILLVGLGSLGAPAAVELARSGAGELRLIDSDFVEPGSTVRWPLGLTAAGMRKPLALSTFIAAHYPRTKVVAWPHRLGHAFSRSGELAQFHKLAEDADLIVDFTAEGGAHHFLSETARLAKKRFVFAYATPGGVGGLVARFDPGREMGCWFCLQKALYEKKTIPEPPIIESALTQPPGCAEPTFIATNSDLQEVTLEAVRTICSALTPGGEQDYSEMDWDVGVLSMQPNGRRKIPSWTTHQLPRDPDCHCGK